MFDGGRMSMVLLPAGGSARLTDTVLPQDALGHLHRIVCSPCLLHAPRESEVRHLCMSTLQPCLIDDSTQRRLYVSCVKSTERRRESGPSVCKRKSIQYVCLCWPFSRVEKEKSRTTSRGDDVENGGLRPSAWAFS